MAMDNSGKPIFVGDLVRHMDTGENYVVSDVAVTEDRLKVHYKGQTFGWYSSDHYEILERAGEESVLDTILMNQYHLCEEETVEDRGCVAYDMDGEVIDIGDTVRHVGTNNTYVVADLSTNGNMALYYKGKADKWYPANVSFLNSAVYQFG